MNNGQQQGPNVHIQISVLNVGRLSAATSSARLRAWQLRDVATSRRAPSSRRTQKTPKYEYTCQEVPTTREKTFGQTKDTKKGTETKKCIGLQQASTQTWLSEREGRDDAKKSLPASKGKPCSDDRGRASTKGEESGRDRDLTCDPRKPTSRDVTRNAQAATHRKPE
ncbi:hypothetical protein C8R45DRAFT_924305 [Mycena sanguinolenta]|nr:hypothetical protein C8R45DRAFT_924305 [Mycena sanguinolenta]